MPAATIERQSGMVEPPSINTIGQWRWPRPAVTLARVTCSAPEFSAAATNSGFNKEPTMPFNEAQHCLTAAAALGFLMLAPPSHARIVRAAPKEHTMTSHLQHASPTPVQPRTTAENTAIRPFQFRASEAALMELRRRIAVTQWPEKETVADQSQGVPLAPMRELARYWGSGYDWRKAEAKLNALPQFMTTVDGLDIHFIHVR